MMGALRVRKPVNWRRIVVVGGSVVGAADRRAAIDRIGMADLRGRIDRRAIGDDGIVRLS